MSERMRSKNPVPGSSAGTRQIPAPMGAGWGSSPEWRGTGELIVWTGVCLLMVPPVLLILYVWEHT